MNKGAAEGAAQIPNNIGLHLDSQIIPRPLTNTISILDPEAWQYEGASPNSVTLVLQCFNVLELSYVEA